MSLPINDHNNSVLSDNKIENLGEIPKVQSLVKLSLSGNSLKVRYFVNTH